MKIRRSAWGMLHGDRSQSTRRDTGTFSLDIDTARLAPAFLRQGMDASPDAPARMALGLHVRQVQAT